MRAVIAALILLASPALAAQHELTYSIAFRGGLTSNRDVFARTVAAVFDDPRGWALGGRVLFRQTPSGGDFTIWLASPDEMTSFSGDCTAMWNCRVGRNIVINAARWQSGSPYWHGALSDYRVMMINHETGHWFGLDHASCGGSGLLAPVMMQQSKGTGSCLPNPWPLASERHRVAKMLGIGGGN